MLRVSGRGTYKRAKESRTLKNFLLVLLVGWKALAAVAFELANEHLTHHTREWHSSLCFML